MRAQYEVEENADARDQRHRQMTGAIGTLRSSTNIALVALVAVVPLLLVGLNATLSREFDASERQATNIARTFETRQALREILSLHQDIETGQRGYVLTGDSAFLEPHDRARGEVAATFAKLDAISAEGTVTDEQLPALRRASEAKLANADLSVAMVRAGQLAEAQRLVATGEGRRLMDRLRAVVGAIDDAEGRQLAIQTQVSNEGRDSLRRTALAINAALIGLLAIAAFAIARTLAARSRARRQAEDQAARQKAVFEGAKDAMLTINPSGGIETLNPAAARLFGYAPEDLLRRDVGHLFEVAPDRGRVESFLKRLQARRNTSGSVGGDRVEEFWARRSDGTSFPADVTVSPVQLADGVRYLAVLRDVTERKQVDRMKTEFVSTVSHELRTPLTSIAGSLGLLSGGAAGALPERASRLVSIAYDNCQRLVRLINDILDIEKIESGQMAFNSRPIDLAEAAEACVHANVSFAQAHDVEIALQRPVQDAIVMADADRLAQIFTNLISNAVKFSPPGGTVDIAITSLDRRWRLSVADRGPGIPAEFRERIFGKFAQADSSDTRAKGGTGLGLAIVRELALRMSGTVSYEDRDGGGTVFHVDLPAADLAGDETQAVSASPPSGLPVILHVDDDPDMLRIVAAAFEGRADMRSVAGLDAARSLARGTGIDVAILDIGMADGSGLDLIPVLRQRNPAIPIIVFTAQDADGSMEARVDALLVKSRASLEQLVARTLELSGNPVGKDA